MKMLATIVSSLVMGLVMAMSGFSPLLEAQRLLANKRRIFNALLLGITGFIFMIAGFITGLIEAALQYEAQGFVFWSALFTVAAGLLFGGIACVLGAKAFMPVFMPNRLNMAAFDPAQFDIMSLLENFLRNANSAPQPSAAPAEAPTSTVEQPVPRPRTDERAVDEYPPTPAPGFHQAERPQVSH
jgi:hypothetical protein